VTPAKKEQHSERKLRRRKKFVLSLGSSPGLQEMAGPAAGEKRFQGKPGDERGRKNCQKGSHHRDHTRQVENVKKPSAK